jgi:RND family efflux transporter MFP subunit
MYKSSTLVLALSFLLAACSPETEQTKSEPKTALTVTVSAVESIRLTQKISAQGSITAWEESPISSRLSGIPLIEVLAEVGDTVKKGDLLARLDDRTVLVDLAQAEANLAEAKANHIEAQANYQRVQKLRKARTVSEQDLLLAETKATSSEARVKASKALVENQQLRLKDCRIVAVDDGVISAKQASLGQIPTPGNELFKLIRQNRLEWRARLLPEQMSLIETGQTVKINLPDGSVSQGTVRQLAPAMNMQTRLGLAYIDIEAGSNAKAGMYVSGNIQQQDYDALVIPAESIILRDGRSLVFQLDSEGYVTQKNIVTGTRQAEWVEVISGLDIDDLVAVSGAGFLADGDRVSQAEALPGASL